MSIVEQAQAKQPAGKKSLDRDGEGRYFIESE